MIIIGRKLKFSGTETLSYNTVVDRQFIRILHRCAKIDTLHLNVPVGRNLDFPSDRIAEMLNSKKSEKRTFGNQKLLRSYLGIIPIRHVKIASLLSFDCNIRQVNLNYNMSFFHFLG